MALERRLEEVSSVRRRRGEDGLPQGASRRRDSSSLSSGQGKSSRKKVEKSECRRREEGEKMEEKDRGEKLRRSRHRGDSLRAYKERTSREKLTEREHRGREQSEDRRRDLKDRQYAKRDSCGNDRKSDNRRYRSPQVRSGRSRMNRSRDSQVRRTSTSIEGSVSKERQPKRGAHSQHRRSSPDRHAHTSSRHKDGNSDKKYRDARRSNNPGRNNFRSAESGGERSEAEGHAQDGKYKTIGRTNENPRSNKNTVKHHKTSEEPSSSEEERPKKQDQPTGPNKPRAIGMRALRREREKIMEAKFGYTAENNPFGDEDIANPFIWRKKNAYLKAAGVLTKPDPFGLIENAKHKVGEIENVKARREAREQEAQLMEEERAVLAREREQENYGVYAHKENVFHKAQAIKRTEIRLQQGRETPIDLMMKAAKIVEGEHFADMSLLQAPPVEVISAMSVEELNQFEEEAKLHVDGESGEFFGALIVLAKDARGKLEGAATDESFLPKAILTDMTTLLSGKSIGDLEAMEKQIEHKLEDKSGDLDVSYWESILGQLPLYKAKAQTNRVHTLAGQISTSNSRNLSSLQETPSISWETTKKEENPKVEDKNEPKEIKPKQNLSPLLIPFEDFASRTDNAELLNPLDEKEMRLNSRKLIVQKLTKKSTPKIDHLQDAPSIHSLKTTTFDDFVRKEKIGMGADEETMGNEMSSTSRKHYEWESRYATRKPRYFNRVKTGFDWNGYNRTHYDYENPPPKVVQGYKFNIFYPDLIDPAKAPSWALTPCPSEPENAILTFHGGPPYEDVAFKIVNREWGVDRIKGFKNLFEKGILHLHFNFKRFRYRK